MDGEPSNILEDTGEILGIQELENQGLSDECILEYLIQNKTDVVSLCYKNGWTKERLDTALEGADIKERTRRSIKRMFFNFLESDEAFSKLGLLGLTRLGFSDKRILIFLMKKKLDISYICYQSAWDTDRFIFAVDELDFTEKDKEGLILKFMNYKKYGGKWKSAKNGYSNEYFNSLREDDGEESMWEERDEDTREQIRELLELSPLAHCSTECAEI